MFEKSLQSNYQSFSNSGLPNTPFLILIFCKFLDHESNHIKAIAIKFSKKLLNLIINDYEKFHFQFQVFCNNHLKLRTSTYGDHCTS